ncbi:MAG TPA: hypothetical protein DCG13_01125 [Legionellales bacterium]|nr:hypothetical protein [Legionellales bacterium]|tara:strand:+ start:1905 stop:2792 length:888 start_codon:yes stop_codon:yes gene_type:complete
MTKMSLVTPEIEQKKQRDTASNGIGKSLVGLIDAINIGIIYTLFLKPVLFSFYEQIGKYIFFPVTAAAALISAALSWRQAYITKGKLSSVITASIDTLAAMAITIAVIGSLVASSIFLLATPIIFTAVMAGKTLFSAVSVVYYLGRALDTAVPKKKSKYYGLAKEQFIATLAGIIATAATIGVFLLGKSFLAGIGIAAAVIGSALAVRHGYQSIKAMVKTSNNATSETSCLNKATRHQTFEQISSKKPLNRAASCPSLNQSTAKSTFRGFGVFEQHDNSRDETPTRTISQENGLT